VAVASGPEGPAEFSRYSPFVTEPLEERLQVPTFRLDTLLRQFGVANEVLHFVKIDAQASDLDVFHSLGDLSLNCLFLRIETVLAEHGAPARLLHEGQTTFTQDRSAIEAAGFRLLNISRLGVTPRPTSRSST